MSLCPNIAAPRHRGRILLPASADKCMFHFLFPIFHSFFIFSFFVFLFYFILCYFVCMLWFVAGLMKDVRGGFKIWAFENAEMKRKRKTKNELQNFLIRFFTIGEVKGCGKLISDCSSLIFLSLFAYSYYYILFNLEQLTL